jgi:hypothetical protein
VRSELFSIKMSALKETFGEWKHGQRVVRRLGSSPQNSCSDTTGGDAPTAEEKSTAGGETNVLADVPRRPLLGFFLPPTRKEMKIEKEKEKEKHRNALGGRVSRIFNGTARRIFNK